MLHRSVPMLAAAAWPRPTHVPWSINTFGAGTAPSLRAGLAWGTNRAPSMMLRRPRVKSAGFHLMRYGNESKVQ